jgi:phosphoribosylanthranilate isomerase
VQSITPYGVDVSRGVEVAPGIKGHELIRRFVKAARSMNGVIPL